MQSILNQYLASCICGTRLACLLALTLTVLAQTVHGQGTMGMLPDPISSRELEGYADRLALSPEQRRAIGRHFEEYHRQFRELRDREIADVLNAMNEMQRGGMQMPSRRDMERFRRLWDNARNRIRAVDDQFFAMIQDVMTEQQQAMVERVQLARERHRYEGGMTMGMPQRSRDLSEMLLRMNLSPEERETIDPILADYERRLTAAIRRQSEATTGMMFDMYDAMEEAGFNEENMSDPQQMQEVIEYTQQLMQDMFRRIADQAQAVRQLNYRSYRTLVELLDESRRRGFRDEFLRGTFMEIAGLAGSEASQRFAVAVEVQDIDESTRAALEQAREAFEAERDRVVDQAMRFAAEHYRSPFATMMGAEQDEDYQERLEAVLAEGRRVEERGSETLKELLSQERSATVSQEVVQQRRETMAQWREQHGLVNEEEAQTLSSLITSYGDPYVAGAINRRETAIYADMLDLDDDGRALLEQLHEQYREDFDESLSGTFEQLQKMNRNYWQARNDGDRGTDHVAEMFEKRRQAMAFVTAADERFFDDLALVLPDRSDAMERVRMARQRGRYSRAIRATGMAGRDLSQVDLADVLRLLRWSPEQREDIEPTLIEWERDATTMMQEYLDASLDRMQAMETFFAEMQNSDEQRQNWSEMHERRQQLLSRHQQRVQDTLAAMKERTDAVVTTILGKLSDSDAAAFHDAYRRRAFPTIYNDRHAVHTHLRRALNLPDLSNNQREALTDLNLQYNSEYHALTERMVQLQGRRLGAPDMTDSGDMAEFMQSEGEFSRLQFERNELNAKAIREIRGLLSEQQRQGVGELPSAPPAPRPW